MQKIFTDSNRGRKAENIFLWIRERLKYVILAFLLVIALAMGFMLMVAAVILIPLIQWIISKKLNKMNRTTTNTSKKEGCDFIEAEYIVIEENKKK